MSKFFTGSFLYVNILIFTVSHHVYTHVQLVEKSEGIAYGLDKTLKYPKKYFIVYYLYFCLSTVFYNICISAFKNKRFVCLFVC